MTLKWMLYSKMYNTATLGNVGTVQGQDEGKNRPAHPDKLPLSLRRRVMINQPEKMTENCI